ncbi:recombinase family protein, partial [Anaerosalibacter massiliensis]
MIKAASYARFSSDHQREESVEAQLYGNKKYAMKNNIIIVKEYIDRAMTGRTDNREAFQAMMSDAKKGYFDIIIVHKVDRFARNRYDSAVYKHNLKKHGVKVVYSAQTIDDSPEGVLMEGMLESFAEYYSLNLGQEVMKGLKENAKKAQFNGGIPPLGYDVNKYKKYVINDKESYIVKEIFDLYLSGKGYKQIANILNSKGYKNKRGKPFVFNSIPSILKNKKYIGVYEFNKTSRSYGDDGKRNVKKYKDEKDIIRLENAIPKIIPMEVFNMAQEELQRRAKGRGKSKALRDYFLSGITVCGKCNRKMTGHSQRRIKGGEPYFYYRCTGCNNSIRCEVIEKKVLDELNELIFSDLDSILDKIHKYILENQKKTPKELKYLQNELEKTNEEIENIVNLIVKGVGSLELGKKLEQLEEYREMIQDRINIVNVKAAVPESELREWLLNVKKDLDKGTNLKKIVSSFVREIRIYEETYEIDFFVRAPQSGANSYRVAPSAP